MLANSWVAERLTASQEEFSSVESVKLKLNTVWWYDLWMNWEVYGRKRFWGVIAIFIMRDCEKPRETSVRMAGIVARIRTGQVPITSWTCYRWRRLSRSYFRFKTCDVAGYVINRKLWVSINIDGKQIPRIRDTVDDTSVIPWVDNLTERKVPTCSTRSPVWQMLVPIC
jgi:hypothetical protein